MIRRGALRTSRAANFPLVKSRSMVYTIDQLDHAGVVQW